MLCEPWAEEDYLFPLCKHLKANQKIQHPFQDCSFEANANPTFTFIKVSKSHSKQGFISDKLMMEMKAHRRMIKSLVSEDEGNNFNKVFNKLG